MERWFRENGYKKEQIDDTLAEDKTVLRLGLKTLAWSYIKSMTDAELQINRQKLLDTLRPEDRSYIIDNWKPKEFRTIHRYTKTYANLGSTSSQRVEGYHDIVREITNGQLPLEASIQKLCQKVRSIIRDLATSQEDSRQSFPRLAAAPTFKYLRFSITSYALTMLHIEYSKLSMERVQPQLDCQCEILLRYGIACKHYLLRVYRDGRPIPRSLVHPRWWIDGPAITFTQWQPFYDDWDIPSASIPSLAIQQQSTMTRLDQVRQELNLEEVVRVEQAEQRLIRQASTQLLDFAEKRLEEQRLPIGMPDPVPRRKFIQKKKHGPADARVLTANEVLIRQENIREQNERRRAREAQEVKMQENAARLAMPAPFPLPSTIPPPSSAPIPPPAAPRPKTPPPPAPASSPAPPAITLVMRTPERPRPRRAPTPELSPPANQSEDWILSSTAPPKMTDQSRLGKRKRNRTQRMEEAIKGKLL